MYTGMWVCNILVSVYVAHYTVHNILHHACYLSSSGTTAYCKPDSSANTASMWKIFYTPLRNDVLLPEQEEQAGKCVKQLSYMGLEKGHGLDRTEHIPGLKNIMRGGYHHHQYCHSLHV